MVIESETVEALAEDLADTKRELVNLRAAVNVLLDQTKMTGMGQEYLPDNDSVRAAVKDLRQRMKRH